ncbi:MAG: NUDIX domain-containing protein [Bacteroidetes bacterium]|nr:NUDIX domain-containing protein [Bacteroidota bacterium]
MLNLNTTEKSKLDELLFPLTCDFLFSEFGGKILGLEILQNISAKLDFLITPSFTYFKYDKQPEIFFLNFLKCIESYKGINKKVACKISTVADDFSEQSLRGLNSSINNPKVILNKESFTVIQSLVESFISQQNNQINAIALQNFIEIESNVGFICHVYSDEGFLEISFDNNKYIITFNSEGTITHSESTNKDRSIDKISRVIDIHQICLTLRSIREDVNFDCNLEGFIDYQTLIALQLRKIPTDTIFNKATYNQILNFDTTKYSNITLTKLVYGEFDIESEAISIGDLNSNNLSENLIVLNDEVDSKIWEYPTIKERIQGNSGSTLIVSFKNGFHLSHAAEDLPPIGTMRNNFKHICLSWLNNNVLLNKKLRFISDGESALFCYAETNSNDRKRTIVVKGKDVNFIQLDPDFIPPFDKVTSVAVVPFTTEGEMVAALLNRGIDLPGGHVLKSEFTIEEVARREAKEETGITLKEIHIAKIIQSDYYGNTPDKLTYMIVTTGFVDEFLEFIPTEECTAREVLSTTSFVDRYSAGNKLDMKDLIISSQKILGVK